MKRKTRSLAILSVIIFWSIQIFHSPNLAKTAVTSTSCLGGLRCHYVLPSETDGPNNDGSARCHGKTGSGIGCDARDEWGLAAINTNHRLYLPPNLTNTGKLLVFLCGGHGDAEECESVYPVAARQGYHVVGLTYPVNLDDCADTDDKFACFKNVLRETVTGEPVSNRTDFQKHAQDSIINRLVSVLKWANAKHAGEGWNRYLTSSGKIDWTKVNLAGFSNGSTHASYMGTQPDFQSVARIALFSGPNDGTGSANNWTPATYIKHVAGMTDSRYYGLVHFLNKADSPTDQVLFKVTNNWLEFQMYLPPDSQPFYFDPTPGVTPNFGDSHVLISLDPSPNKEHPGTTNWESHMSVVKDKYCDVFKDDGDEKKCDVYGNVTIGYEPAWRCVLGTGDRGASSAPVANAGQPKVIECQGNGGANVTLDGSLSKDNDCELLRYAWAGPFGKASGRNPSVFMSLGTYILSLIVSDDWQDSKSGLTQMSVVDTKPPELRVTLTAAVEAQQNQMIRINATVSVADVCGGVRPRVVLTSITTERSGEANANRALSDVQEADFGTFDRSFLLRANSASGRTYTVTYTATDTSGNQTQSSATIHLQHAH